jgi:hypothetical protein
MYSHNTKTQKNTEVYGMLMTVLRLEISLLYFTGKLAEGTPFQQ